MLLIESDSLANQNIATALEIGSLTAASDLHLFIRVAADQIAGGGDYQIFATVQLAGAGSAYRIAPITTAAVAAGVTAAMFISSPFAVAATDVVKVYLLGLAGDTTTVDTTCQFWQADYVTETLLEGGTLAVDIDSLTITPTTGVGVTVESPDNYGVSLDGPNAGLYISGSTYGMLIGKPGTTLTGLSITGSNRGANLSGAADGDLYLVNDGGKFSPATIWSAATRTLTSFGTLVADVWAYATRTLTANVNNVTIVSAVSGNTITVYEYDTWLFTVTDSSLAMTDYENLSFVVKANADDTDANAILIADITTGLVRIGQAAATAANLATVTKNSATSFTVQVEMSEVATKIASSYRGSYNWWLKGIDTTDTPDQGFTLITGTFVISGGGARQIL